ncbi:glycosyltransferase family 39 protein [Oscillatoria sp. FACHB-1406]|uniref:glycosyltransferase family 39 protein n=1 Tax=Oscillatoria sp. FACHB-1406 TaxID=2692846 RepID=UPI001682C2E0|nr:glycosyltransferase family 39 protein [Oscillatoria sp. FACHB-1406]MBD2577932.1 glycosyltransferase family 39 protein [Oscillatoria sp. FACHB-1406]
MFKKSAIFLFIIVLVLGIFFRFADFDKKVYSADEVRSILRLSGMRSSAFIETKFTGDILSVEDLQHYQKPGTDRTLGDALDAIAGNPEHPPLYPLLTRFWMQIFNTPSAARVFSIVLSLLALPCIYWWCLELFESPAVGWVAVALVAISPVQMMAAQNTTQYSLWTVAIALSSALLLRALRQPTLKLWILYAVTIAMGFYTHLFFAFVALAQGIYVLLVQRFRYTPILKAYLLSAGSGFVLFFPWLFHIFNNLDTVRNNTKYYRQFDNNIGKIVTKLIDNTGNTFINFYTPTRLDKYLDYAIVILVIFAFYLLCRYTPLKIWSFLILLAVIPALAQIVPDLISTSIRSLQARYYLPYFLAAELAIAGGVIHLMSGHKQLQRNLGKILLIFLLVGGILSGIELLGAQDWGLDDQRGTASSENLKIAPEINRAERPLVISEATHSFLLALSYLVNPKVRFQLLKNEDEAQWQQKVNLEQESREFSDLFLYYPDKQFLEFIARDRNFKAEPVVNKRLYKLVKTSP